MCHCLPQNHVKPLAYTRRLDTRLDSFLRRQLGLAARTSLDFRVCCIAGAGAISWSSKKQSIITLSSTESEYIALTNSARQITWLRDIWAELTDSIIDPSRLFTDNQGALALAQSGAYHARTKHIDIQYHYIREAVKNCLISLNYCPTEDMTADILTKALARPQFEKLRGMLGLRSA